MIVSTGQKEKASLEYMLPETNGSSFVSDAAEACSSGTNPEIGSIDTATNAEIAFRKKAGRRDCTTFSLMRMSLMGNSVRNRTDPSDINYMVSFFIFK